MNHTDDKSNCSSLLIYNIYIFNQVEIIHFKDEMSQREKTNIEHQSVKQLITFYLYVALIK